jgi:hypothetical protein
MIKPEDIRYGKMPFHTAQSRNLVNFCRHLSVETMDASFAGDYAFRDAGSRFSLLKSPDTAPGPDECYSLFLRDARLVFNKLLGMNVRYTGLDESKQADISTYNSMNYYRSHVEEYFFHNGIIPMPPTEGECFFWFPTTDVLSICYRLINKSPVDVSVDLSWFSEGDPGEGFHYLVTEKGFIFTNTRIINPKSYVNISEIMAQDNDISFVINGIRVETDYISRVIPANGEIVCRFAMRFTFNDEPIPEWPTNLWSEDDLCRVINDTESAYAKIAETPIEMRKHQDLILKAAGTLRSLRYRDYDVNKQSCMTIHAGKTGCAATWFWDTGTTLPALGLMRENETAAGALQILTTGIKEDGTPPVTYEHQQYLYSYQIPLLAWGTGHYFSECGDINLMAKFYRPLSRYVQHWLDKYIVDQYGLVAYPTGNTSLDDALRWHSGSPLTPQPGEQWHEKQWGKMQQDLFVSPDINAFLVLELRTLAGMAKALGMPDDFVLRWQQQADNLAVAINKWLIEPETKCYQDRNIQTGKFNGMVQLGSFIPVYAGIAPPEIAEHLCREYLLSPKHFLTPFPFPVVDRAHPTFRSGGFLYSPAAFPGSLVQQSYWRGRTWIHGNNWYLGALWQSGFKYEADELADVILTAISRGDGINECYDSLTGFGNGHPEFMWSSAAVLMMAHHFYRKNPVAELL